MQRVVITRCGVGFASGLIKLRLCAPRMQLRCFGSTQVGPSAVQSEAVKVAVKSSKSKTANRVETIEKIQPKRTRKAKEISSSEVVATVALNAVDYSRMSPREHVLLRPQMYVGSTEPTEPGSSWRFDATTGNLAGLSPDEAASTPALRKVICSFC